MKFKKIDLRGELTINGLTGTSGQAIGFSGSNVEWIDAASGGSPNQLSVNGYNYIMVTATASPSENGQTLYDTYLNLSTYNINGAAENNRLVVFITPGIYDFSTIGPIAAQNYVDIIGLSTNPYDTILQNTSTGVVISCDADFGLQNVYLTGEGFLQNTSSSIYARFKNIVIGGNTFNGSFDYLNGEFENIKVLSGSSFAWVNNDIDGSYKNIECDSADKVFYANGGISGRFEDIKIYNNTGDIFFGAAGIDAKFKNVKINNFIGGGGDIFKTTNSSIIGEYNNIYIEPYGSSVFTPTGGNLGDSTSRFENIEIKNSASSFYYGASLSGKFKNIKISSASTDGAFASMSSFEPNTEFDNIDIATCYSAFTSNSLDINGTFRNVTVLDIDGSIFESSQNLYGTFSNIKIGRVGTNSFNSTNDIIADLQNLEIGESSGDVFVCSNIITMSNLKHIKVGGDMTNFMKANSDIVINGESDDIEVGNITSRSFFTSGGVYGTFSNMKFGNVSASSFAGSFYGSMKNITFGDIGGLFTSGDSKFGYLENIKIGNSSGSILTSDNLPGIIKNLEIGNITGDFMKSPSGIGGIFENFKIGNISGDCLYNNDSSGGIIGDFRNLSFGNINGDLFRTDDGLASFVETITNSIFKDIDVKAANNIFKTNTDPFLMERIGNSRFENISIGTCSNIFWAGQVNSTTEVKNLTMTGRIYPGVTNQGKILNSNINMSDRVVASASFITLADVQYSKIISKPIIPPNFTVTVSRYSTFNYATSSALLNSIIDTSATF